MVKNFLLEMQHRIYVNNLKLRLQELLDAKNAGVHTAVSDKALLVLLGVDLYTQYIAALDATPEPNVEGVRLVVNRVAAEYLVEMQGLLDSYKITYSPSMHAKPNVAAVVKPNYKHKPKHAPRPPKLGKRASKVYRCFKAKNKLWALAERMEQKLSPAEKQQLPFVAKGDPEFWVSNRMELRFRVWSERDDRAAGEKEVRRRHAVQLAFLSTLYDRLKPAAPPPPNLKVVGGSQYR